MADYEPVTLEFQFRNRRFRDAERGLQAFGQALGRGMHDAAPVLSRELRVFLDGVAEAMARRHGNPWPSGTGPNTLSKRSGNLIRSIKESVRVEGTTLDNIMGGIGGIFYLRVQERGATVRARRSKYLTIPLPTALNSDGTPIKRSAREWQNTFVAESRAGNLLIFQRRGREIVPLYVLKKHVKITARAGMQTTLRVGLPYFVDRAMDQMLKELLRSR